MDSKSVKSEYKRLKKRVKGSPGLFTRVAALELELGKVKSAKSRLENGIQTYPDSVVAHSLLAECLSQLGEHESSLKEWEDVMTSEPFNQEARNGYIRELAFLERDDAMNEALNELYLIDPYNTEITGRHKEILLKEIRDKHPNERVWKQDWHPGDFTSIGAVARSIAYERGYSKTRSNLPDGFEPQIDEDILEKIISNLPEKELDTDIEAGFKEALDDQQGVEDIIEELDVDDAEAKALEALLDSDEEADLDVDDFFTKKEVTREEVLKSVEEQTGMDYSEDDVDVEHADEDVPVDQLETGQEVDEAQQTEQPKADDEEITIVEQTTSVPRENRLKKALENCGVKKLDDIIDLEDLIDLIVQDDFVLVEKTVIRHVSEEEKKHEVTQTDLDKLVDSTEHSVPDVVDNGMDEIPPDLDQPLSQHDLDAILGSPEPEHTSTPEPAPAASSGPLSQSELDALVAANKAAKEEESPETPEPGGSLDQNELDVLVSATKKEVDEPDEPSGPLSQSELDKLIAANKSGQKAEKPAEKTSSGPLSQDELDALVAANNKKETLVEEPGGSLNQNELDALIAATKKEKKVEESSGPLSQDELNKLVVASKSDAISTEDKAPKEEPSSGQLDQNALDALIADRKQKDTSAEAPGGSLNQNELDALIAATKKEKNAEEKDEELSGPLSQDDLDKLVSAKKGDKEPAIDEAPPEESSSGPLDQNALDALVAANKKKETPAEEPGGSLNQNELDALIAATKKEKPTEEKSTEPSGPLSQDELNKLVAASKGDDESTINETPQEESPSGPLDQNALNALVAASKQKKSAEEKVEEPYRSLSQDDLDKLVASKNADSNIDQETDPKEADSISELDDLEGPLDQNVLDNLIQAHKTEHPEADERSSISKAAQKLRDKLQESGVDKLDDIPVMHDEESVNVNQEVIDTVTRTKSPFEDDVTQDDLTAAIDENLQTLIEKEGLDPEKLSDQEELNSLIKKMKEEGGASEVIDSDKPKVRIGTLSLDELHSHLGDEHGISFTIETRDEGEEVSQVEKVSEKAEKYDDQDKVDAILTDSDEDDQPVEAESDLAPKPEPEPEPEKVVEQEKDVPVSGKPAFVAPPNPEAIKKARMKPPVREEETKPAEIKGPVSKTFVRLCMAQGKFKHAAEILNRLEEKTPDDPEVAKLKEEVLEKI